MKLRKKEAIAAYVISAPCLMGFLILYLIPFIISFYNCFTKGIGDVQFVGFQNFVDLFENSAFKLAGANTIYFMLLSVPLVMVISLLIALLLNVKVKGISFFRTITIMPLVIPVASIILVWQILFQYNGVINGILSKFNIGAVDWINSDWSIYILVLVYLWKNCAYIVIIFIVGLNNIPESYYEAAYIDGCGKIKSFFSITLPSLVPTMFFVFIISIVNSFKVFREAYLLAGNYPNKNMYLLQHFLNNNFMNLNLQTLSTASFVVFGFICLLVYLLFKFQKKRSLEI